MQKLTLTLTLLLILTFSAAMAGDIYHQRALEVRGGMSMYLFMDDPVDWAQQFPSSVSDKMEFAADAGLSILYKSHNFVWNIGYNHLFASRTTFGDGDYEEVVEANEFFIVPGFILFPDSKLNFSIGAGPTLMMASLDRNSPMGGNMGEFYGATGRNMGVLALANIEYLYKPNLALKVGGGFRTVFIDDINFVKTVDNQDYSYTVMWTNSSGAESNRSYELDFTGLFIEFGLRWYFQSKAKW
ncbi:MAG: hypothetical protein HQ591_08735 [candidate division Zixibacteria bacterium]|nr:hypothetical protein [Candidatus Tariuqbacter arcticus]